MLESLDYSYDFCSLIVRREAGNFGYGFRLLPYERRRSMHALYAFMRHTDDLVDAAGAAGPKRQALAAWRSEMVQALAGGPCTWPGLPALADTVERYRINPAHLHEVIDGVDMDVEPRVYETFDELKTYCDRVASAVGLCCLSIWGYRSEGGRAERLASACGQALQLTNILRDVREDALAGRVYLPREDQKRFGVEPDAFRSERTTPALRSLFAFQGERAAAFYEEARPLVSLVEPEGRPVFRAIVGIYRALLDEIIRRDYNVLAGRISLPPWRKTAIALRSLVG